MVFLNIKQLRATAKLESGRKEGKRMMEMEGFQELEYAYKGGIKLNLAAEKMIDTLFSSRLLKEGYYTFVGSDLHRLTLWRRAIQDRVLSRKEFASLRSD